MPDAPAVYDATPWAGQLEQTYTIEVSPGRPILCKKLSLVEELASGLLPNELERYILSPDPEHLDMELDESGQWQRKSDMVLSMEQSDRWQNRLRVCARAMLQPRLKLKGTPNYKAGEIAPTDLTFGEIYRVWMVAVVEVVPALPATFPGTAGARDGRGAGKPVLPDEALPGDDAEHVPGLPAEHASGAVLEPVA